jgi:HK97 family phage major capsid protein
MRGAPNHIHVWKSRQAALVAFCAAVGVRADAEDPTIVGYRRRQEELIETSNNILAAADTESRELTTDERRRISDNSSEVERLEEEIALRRSVAAQDQRMREPQPRRTSASAAEPLNEDEGHQPAAAARPQASATHIQTTHISTPATRAAQRGNGGFNSFGHFAQSVRNAVVNPSTMDGRLRAALSTYGSEGVGADGGFAVPADYRTEIMRLVQAEESLFSMVDATPTASNTVNVLTDETSAYSTSGVRVYTRAEAAAMTQSKPQLKDMQVRLNEIYAFVPMTDELLADAPMMSSYLTTKAGEALQFALSNYIVNGTGVGQPLGILNSGALVSVSAEGSQTSGTVHADNIVKMWARMPGAVRNKAVWLINQDVEPDLMRLGAVVKTASGTATGGMPIYMPPGGLSASPFATLLGRPVITTEACAAIGSVGDIVLAYMGGYFAPFKAGGVKSDVSMHLYFDQGVTAFRWSLRVGGQPWLSAPIARKNGSNTLSHFIALAAR